VASAITDGDITIENFPARDLEIPLIHLRDSGAHWESVGADVIRVKGSTPYPIDIATGPYPGINSDMQPLFAVFAAHAHGQSTINDLRFPGRYRYAEEMGKLGVRFDTAENELRIFGGNAMVGAPVDAVDLRAGIALVLCGLTAAGQTEITNAWQAERGYDRLIEKLTALGGHIESV
jgi:UDP-N-acetylglucosamine 1-carboxyvinyltransferase